MATARWIVKQLHRYIYYMHACTDTSLCMTVIYESHVVFKTLLHFQKDLLQHQNIQIQNQIGKQPLIQLVNSEFYQMHCCQRKFLHKLFQRNGHMIFIVLIAVIHSEVHQFTI